MAALVHYLDPDLLPLCGTGTGGYTATPVVSDVTCEACHSILALHA